MDFINCDNIWYTLNSYLESLKARMAASHKGKIDSFLFYFLGHGARVQGEDCLIDTEGDPTTVKSLIQLIEESGVNADKYFLILDCCRNVTASSTKSLNKDHDGNFVPKQDTNITVVYATQAGVITPDVENNTITSSIVELLRSRQSIKVESLGKELTKIWDSKQKRKEFTPKVDFTPRYENTNFP